MKSTTGPRSMPRMYFSPLPPYRWNGFDGSGMNRDSYNAIASEWDAARTSPSARERELIDSLLRDLKAPARVLDLGCGTGRPIAEAILARGFDVTGVDQSEQLLELARSRFPRGRWLHAQMESFEPDEIYDAAVIWDSLFHIRRELHEAILRTAVRSLRPGGRLLLTAGGSDHPAFTDTMFERTFFYDSHPPEALLAILNGLGLSIEIEELINPPTDGRDKGRLAVLARV